VLPMHACAREHAGIDDMLVGQHRRRLSRWWWSEWGRWVGKMRS
jgi:hypothetical protein